MAGLKSAPQASVTDTALYIAGISRELRELARSTDLDFLAYLLAMVEEDAAEIARRQREGAGTAIRALSSVEQ
jgi:hypothetical protein